MNHIMQKKTVIQQQKLSCSSWASADTAELLSWKFPGWLKRSPATAMENRYLTISKDFKNTPKKRIKY